MLGTVESLEVRNRIWKRVVGCWLVLAAFAVASDPPTAIVPMTVCEVLTDLAAHEGKSVAVLGRYSFRRDGRWMGEESCGASAGMLWLNEDASAPRPPGNFDIDTPVLNKKFAEMTKHTSLGKFRFGQPDYDRWAVVYGKIALRKGDDAKKAPAELLFRGSGVVMFLTTEK
jgi:hypothetical protein